jgi:hypothetical protein
MSKKIINPQTTQKQSVRGDHHIINFENSTVYGCSCGMMFRPDVRTMTAAESAMRSHRFAVGEYFDNPNMDDRLCDKTHGP